MATNFWMKLWHDILDDPKMGMMSDRLWRRSIELMLIASEYGAGGLLPTLEEIAWRLRPLSSEELETDLVELARFHIVDQVDGRWWVTNFEKRQSAATGPERRKHHWASKRKKEKYYNSLEKEQEVNAERTKSERKVNESFVQNRIEHNETEVKGEKKPRRSSPEQQFVKNLSLYFEEVTGIPWIEPKTKSDWSDAQVKWLKPLKKIAEYSKWDFDLAKKLMMQALQRAAGNYTVYQPKSIEGEVAAVIGEMNRGQFKETRHTMTDDQFRAMLRAQAANVDE